jgi:hypothetical protein
MNKFFICFFSICLCASAYAQNNVGIGTPTPNSDAILDLTSTTMGFLAPRTHIGSIPLPVPNGLIIFDVDSQCYELYNTVGGIGKWNNMCAPKGDWLITGNAGTSSAVNFAGTLDAQDFVLRSNNVEVLRATTAGAVGIQTPAPDPTSILDITSTTKGVLFPALTTAQENAITTPAVGLTIYNTTLNVHQFWNGTCWVNVGQTVCSFVYTTSYLTPAHNTDCLLVSNFSSVSDTLQVGLVSGTASPVILTALGVPAGVIVSFSNNYLLPPQQSIMTFTALPSALPGTYNIVILASSGSTVQTLNYTLIVFGFNLLITPPDTTVGSGNLQSGGYISQAAVSIGNSSACSSSGGFAQLSATVNGTTLGSIGNDVVVSFATTSLPIPGTTQMYLTSNCPPAGIYDIQVQAQIGVTSSYATYTLTVTGTTPVHVSTNQTDLNLSTLFPPGACAGSDTVIIDPGVTVCSSGTLVGGIPTPAITTGAMVGNLVLINNGTITGAGGAGGTDPPVVTVSSCPTANGGPGGDAIDIAGNVTTKIINNGTISAGGGGGGAGAAVPGASIAAICGFTLSGNFPGAGGGGGAGCAVGPGGASACNAGAPGGATTGGTGGPTQQSGGCGTSCNLLFFSVGANSGAGGNGGALGQPGNPGLGPNTVGNITLGTACPLGSGGAPGYTVNGNNCGCLVGGTIQGGGTVNGTTHP